VLDYLAQTRTVDGVLLIIRCAQVTTGASTRFEVHIQGNSEIAVYDVAGTEEEQLPERIEEMASAFLAAYQLREEWGA